MMRLMKDPKLPLQLLKLSTHYKQAPHETLVAVINHGYMNMYRRICFLRKFYMLVSLSMAIEPFGSWPLIQ